MFENVIFGFISMEKCANKRLLCTQSVSIKITFNEATENVKVQLRNISLSPVSMLLIILDERSTISKDTILFNYVLLLLLVTSLRTPKENDPAF